MEAWRRLHSHGGISGNLEMSGMEEWPKAHFTWIWKEIVSICGFFSTEPLPARQISPPGTSDPAHVDTP